LQAKASADAIAAIAAWGAAFAALPCLRGHAAACDHERNRLDEMLEKRVIRRAAIRSNPHQGSH
jgi:hypothetical protein